jgi:hypothetical protein
MGLGALRAGLIGHFFGVLCFIKLLVINKE